MFNQFFISLFWYNEFTVVRQDALHFDSIMNPKSKVWFGLLPNVWRIKGNQTMKFDPLIDYNVRNIFLEKSYTKCDRETSARPFSKKLKLSISLDQESNVSYSLFLLYAKPKAIEIYWNYAADYLHLPHIKLF